MRQTAIDKLFSFVAVVMVSVQLFSAGADFADNHVADGVISLVLAAFWGGYLLIIWTARGHEIKWRKKYEAVTDKFFEQLIKTVEESGSAEVTVEKKKPATQGKGKIKGATAKKPAAKKASKK